MAEKTEKATPKKLRDARKKGQVAKSKDFPSAFTFIVSISVVLLGSRRLFDILADYMKGTFQMVSKNPDLHSRAGGLIRQAIDIIFATSAPVLIFTTIVGILVNFLIVGPLFSLESMKPDIKKLNPITNLKNMFKIKTFIELIKSVLKIAGASFLIYTVISTSLPEIISCAGLPIIGATMVFSSFLFKVIIRVGIFFIAIAVFDLVFQKKNFAKEMKMEKFEVKQEMKDTEGNPELKGKRKQVAQEIAYQEGPGATKRAKAVVSNPVHIAVALEYEAETDPAPKICLMGKGELAKGILKVAEESNIPIFRNPELAQELWDTGQISEYVPEETYETIAEILKWIGELDTGSDEEVLEIFK